MPRGRAWRLDRRVDKIVRRFQKKLGPNPPSLREIDEDMYDEYGLPR